MTTTEPARVLRRLAVPVGVTVVVLVAVWLWRPACGCSCNAGPGPRWGRPLKGTSGDQNYSVAREVVLAGPVTVLIWCRAFAAPVAAATVTVPA